MAGRGQTEGRGEEGLEGVGEQAKGQWVAEADGQCPSSLWAWPRKALQPAEVHPGCTGIAQPLQCLEPFSGTLASSQADALLAGVGI